MAGVLLYGKPGSGKSSAVLRAFTGSGSASQDYWLTFEPGALDVRFNAQVNPTGRQPRFVQAIDSRRPFEEAVQHVRAAAKLIKSGHAAAVVFDTLSSWADREFNRIRRPRSDGGDDIAEGYGRAGRELSKRLFDLLYEIEEAGGHFIAICHEREPATIEGRRTLGGPKLPGDLPERVAAHFSLVLRCTVDNDVNGRRRVFYCDPMSESWIARDRFGVCTEKEPMDLRALLMRIGDNVRRFQAAGGRAPTPSANGQEPQSQTTTIR